MPAGVAGCHHVCMSDAWSTEETPPPSVQPPPPPLHRSRRHKVVAGVCGGLGRHWDLDPVIFRIVLAVLAVSGGVGLIVYGIAWLLIPLEGEDENEGRRLLSGRVEGPALTALLFALVGCGLLLSVLNNGGVMSFTVMLTLAAVGSAYWAQQRRHGADSAGAAGPSAAQPTPDAPPETQAPPTPNPPSWWRDSLSKESTDRTLYLWGPPAVAYERAAHAARSAGRPSAENPPPGPRSAHRPPRAGRSIGGWTFLLALASGTVATVVARDGHPLGTSLQVGLACALGALGLGLVVSTWFGRTGGGTVFLVVLTPALLAVVSVLPKNITAHWAHRAWTPTSAEAVQPLYEMGAGRGRLDLSEVDFQGRSSVATRAEVGVGRLSVTVPSRVTTELHVEVGLGDVHLPDEPSGDVDISTGQDKTLTLRPQGLKAGEQPHGTLKLDIKIGAGQVEVLRGAA